MRMLKNKLGENTKTFLLIALVLVGLFIYMTKAPTTTTTTTISGATTSGVMPACGEKAPVKDAAGNPICVCVNHDTTAVTFNDLDGGKTNVDPGQSIFIIKNGNKAGSNVSDDGTMTMNPGDNYIALFGYQSTSYTQAVKKGFIGCSGAETVEQVIWDNSGTPTLTFYNKNGDSNNKTAGGTDNEALTTDDIVQVTLAVSGVTNDCYGATKDSGLDQTGHMQVFKWNSSEFDYVSIIDKLDWSEPFVEVGIPTIYSTLTGSSLKAYHNSDALCGSTTKKEKLELNVAAVNPDSGVQTAGNNINVTFFDYAGYIGEDGLPRGGVMNSTSADIGSATEHTKAFYYT